MALDIFKEDVSDIKIRKNDYQNKVDSIIENNLDIDIDGVNLLDMKEEKKVKKSPLTIYLEQEELEILKSVSVIKNTTVQKTISNLIKSTVKTTKANLPSDFKVQDMVKKYDKENKVKKNNK
ncbi:hypothetical protein [Paraclostridium bifermentans]|uniref:hypothetical protein n=1 Tax=Paraclostridium bifermentans TaxID=1490 RepID=UPI001159D6D7|nr:hypothetical protein [Paraclostridium bifermentans]TQO55586.1 hypothetical protein D5S05_17385 [Paraclostridium bifermentans]